MKKVKEIKITTYNLENDWYVDIVETEYKFGAWLYQEPNGIKTFMWGEPKIRPNGINSTLKSFIEEVSLLWKEYTESYLEDILVLENYYNYRY